LQEAWSRLKSVLDRQGLTTADLVRRVSEQGDRVNAKSLYRLADPQEPLEKVDMRVIGAICQALGVGIGDLLTFEEPTLTEDFDAAKQARMDALLTRHHASGTFTAAEMAELQALVEEAETVARGNARRLANHKRRLQRGGSRRVVQNIEIGEGN
jgi:DNA-binding Xre family transcriptional regulator